MEMLIVLALVFFFGYPFLASALGSGGLRARLRRLEEQVQDLTARLAAAEQQRSAQAGPAQAQAAQRTAAAPFMPGPEGRSVPSTIPGAGAGAPQASTAAAPAAGAPFGTVSQAGQRADAETTPAGADIPASPALAATGTTAATPATPATTATPADPATPAARADHAMPATASAPAADQDAARTPSASTAPLPPPAAPASPAPPASAHHQARPAAVRPPRPPRPPMAEPAWVGKARGWLLSGNLVAKLGLIILFIGVSFLLKYAAERITVPIEVRLAGVVLADLALLVWGWRLRTSRRGLALPIQGAALAILMLTTFGAYRLYHLLPAGGAFGVLFVLTAFTCVLAVLQDAIWLAVFGIAGGFLAPLLTSTGHGSHIGLFTYYALLNAGVLAIALRKAWRALNLLGFAFTFVIGTAWGVLRYEPGADYLSVQLFLLLFFVFYVAIAILFATRQTASLKQYVDATIVFGTPLCAFGLQLALVHDRHLGNAFSALGFGLFYTALALALWRRRAGSLKLLVESFLAMGIVFGTLALPFALDGRWTSAAWALEGAGVVWVGLRQRQRLTWMFGLLVQLGAWLSFLGAISGLDPAAARQSNLWLGFLILAGTAFFMATTFRRQAGRDQPVLPGAASWLLALAALWFLGGAWTEVLLRAHGSALGNLLALSALATAALLAFIAARLDWARARGFAIAVQMAGGAALLIAAAIDWDWWHAPATLNEQPLLGALLIGAAALFSSRALARARPPVVSGLPGLLLAWGGFWCFGPLLNGVSGWLALQIAPDGAGLGDTWWALAALLATAASLGFVQLARRTDWAGARWLGLPGWVALAWVTAEVLVTLYLADKLPAPAVWLCWAASWVGAAMLLRGWAGAGWPLASGLRRAVYLVRLAGPWVMLWKVGELVLGRWLAGSGAEADLLASGGWRISGSWTHFLPFWAMLASLAWLWRRGVDERWPAAPEGAWVRTRLLPVALGWSLLLVLVWNLRQDGTMAPLPYVPLLNPLDLTTGFALLLALYAHRSAGLATRRPLVALAGAAYFWFNLILLRSAAHYLGLPYEVDPLFGSQFIQALLSLVWTISALVLMRHAAARLSRPRWVAGAALLALVLVKLFLVDLSGVGSVARIVSFVGVGLLMVLIGYLAPWPATEPTETSA